jgi:predicted RNA-binding protein with PIN domain
MSKNLHFYRITVFSEEVTQGFSRDNVYESSKSLFKGGENYAAEFIEKYFETISLNSMFISASAIEKIIPKFSEKLKYIFDPKFGSFFMVDQEIWSALEKIIEQNIRDIFKEKKKAQLTDRLKENYEISSDYALLLELFKKNLLFGNIF